MPLRYPEECSRGCTDCRPLAAIIADDGNDDFICMGENDGKRIRVKRDRYRFCQKSIEGVDIMVNHDRRDVADWISVLAQGVSMLELEALDHDEDFQQNYVAQEVGQHEQ